MLDRTLEKNDHIVCALREAMSAGEHGLDAVPKLVKKMIRGDHWQRRIVEKTGEEVIFKRFEQFAATPPLEGLGSSWETLKNICQADKEAQSLIDAAVQNPHGRPSRNVDIINVLRPTGTSSATALRRLRSQRPDLHSQVIAGNKSPHAAMIEAGFRPKKIQVEPEPEKLAQAIKKHLTCEQIDALLQLLS